MAELLLIKHFPTRFTEVEIVGPTFQRQGNRSTEQRQMWGRRRLIIDALNTFQISDTKPKCTKGDVWRRKLTPHLFRTFHLLHELREKWMNIV